MDDATGMPFRNGGRIMEAQEKKIDAPKSEYPKLYIQSIARHELGK